MEKLSGVYPPIPTPFDSSGAILWDKLKENLEIWAGQPLKGIVSPGSNSEAVHLNSKERIKIWNICMEALEPKGKLLIAGTGVETTRESIEFSKKASDVGADATLVLPPYFYKPQMTHDVLKSHYYEIADNSPIDIVLYNAPQFVGINLSLKTIITLADHPRIIGIKDSSADIIKMSRLSARRPNFLVFAGTASVFLPYLSIGGAGGIMALANIAASRLDQIFQDFRSGLFNRAQEEQLKLAEINTAVTKTYGVPGLKYAMDKLGLIGGFSRRPLLPLGSFAKKEIDDLIRESNLKPLS